MFYSLSESFEIEHTDDIESYIDIENENFKGDFEGRLLKEYVVKTEDGIVDLNFDNYKAMKEAIPREKHIFR